MSNVSTQKNLFLILGNQLFSPQLIQEKLKQLNVKDIQFFMREDAELCTYYRFHKHKIIFFLAAMRTYAQELQDCHLKVHYEQLTYNSQTQPDNYNSSDYLTPLKENENKTFSHQELKYEDSLKFYIQQNHITDLYFFEIEDKFFEKRILKLIKNLKVIPHLLANPMFLTSRKNFQDYISQSKKPFMKTFYENQRKKFKILIDHDSNPIGGQWSFDSENRLALPDSVKPQDVPMILPSITVIEVSKLTEKLFTSHPGQVDQFWLPVSREEAHKWLQHFLENKLNDFGPYEDALAQHSDFVFHSVLTPFLNSGLLTPEEVIRATLHYSKNNKISLASLEGFIRQIIGWREFIRGIYQNYSTQQETTNFFQHQKKLSSHWYTATTGIAPLDHCLKKTLRYSYNHHIERLMVIGSLMLLLEIHPHEAHRWFMEMYIDSSDWVMGPNVYGMALFSDGGIFATKPYFCGSNYYRKMGKYKATESWCDGVDGLYWSFIEKHQDFFSKNHRMSMMVSTVKKMDKNKKQTLYSAAETLRIKLTI